MTFQSTAQAGVSLDLAEDLHFLRMLTMRVPGTPALGRSANDPLHLPRHCLHPSICLKPDRCNRVPNPSVKAIARSSALRHFNVHIRKSKMLPSRRAPFFSVLLCRRFRDFVMLVPHTHADASQVHQAIVIS